MKIGKTDTTIICIRTKHIRDKLLRNGSFHYKQWHSYVYVYSLKEYSGDQNKNTSNIYYGT